jgi:hypothetical protein
MLLDSESLLDPKYLNSLKHLDKYSVLGGYSATQDPLESQHQEVAAAITLLQSLPISLSSDQQARLLSAFHSEVLRATKAVEDPMTSELVLKLKGICRYHEAMVRNDERLRRRSEKKNETTKKDKDAKAPLSLPAQLAISFGVEMIMMLISKASSADPDVYAQVISCASRVLSLAPPMALANLDPAVSSAIDRLSEFFEKLLEGQLPRVTEADQLAALTPLLGLSLAKGSLSQVLSVASKLLELKNHQQFSETTSSMHAALQNLRQLKGTARIKVEWRNNNQGPSIVVSQEGASVTRTDSSGWGTAVSEQEFSEGSHYIEMEITNDSSSYLAVGVIDAAYADLTTFLSCASACTIRTTGECYIKGTETTTGFTYATGDKIGIYLNMEEKQITFFKNQVPQTAPPHAVFDKVRFAACFGGSNQQVKINSLADAPEGILIGSTVQTAVQEAPLEEAFPIQPGQMMKLARYGGLTSSLEGASPSDVSGFILASMEQLHQAKTRPLGLEDHIETHHPNLPHKASQGLAYEITPATFKYLTKILEVKVQELQTSKDWSKLDFQGTASILMTTLRMLRGHLYIAIHLNIHSEVVSANVKDNAYNVLNSIASLAEAKGRELSPADKLLIGYVKRQAQLTIIHGFQIFYSDASHQLSYLLESLQSPELSQPGSIRQLIFTKLSRPSVLSSIFSEDTRIKSVIQLALELSKNLTIEAVRGRHAENHAIRMLSTLQKLLYSKAARLNFDPQLMTSVAEYSLDLLEATLQCLETAKQASRGPFSAEFIERLKGSLIGNFATEALLTLSLFEWDLDFATALIEKLGRLVEAVNSCEADPPKLVTGTKACSEVYESEHPYPNSSNLSKLIKFPGATTYKVTFSPNCKTESSYDYLELWTDETKTNKIGRYEGSGFPTETVSVESSQVFFTFTSDGSTNFWGWSAEVTAETSVSYFELTWLDNLRSASNLLLVQLSKALVKGDLVQAKEVPTLFDNALFKYGVKDSAAGRLEAPTAGLHLGLARLSEYEPDLLASVKREGVNPLLNLKKTMSAAMVMPMAKRVTLKSYVREFSTAASMRFSDIPFVDQFISGTPKLLASWQQIKTKSGLSGPAANIGRDALDQSERALFAVFASFFEITDLLGKLFDTPEDLSETVKFIVKQANKVRSWAQTYRQKRSDAGVELTYQDINLELVHKCLVLLQSEYREALNYLGVSQVLTELLPSIKRSAEKVKGGKWKSVKKAMNSASKLMDLAKLRGMKTKQPKEEVKEFMDVSALIYSFFEASAKPEEIVRHMDWLRTKAMARIIGINCLNRALNSLSPSLHRLLASQVANAFSEGLISKKTGQKTHYSEGLDGIDPRLRSCLVTAFFSLYQTFLNVLTFSNSESVDCCSPEISSSYLAIFNALSFPFEAVDYPNLMELRMREPLEFLMTWAQGSINTLNTEKRFDFSQVISTLTVHDETQYRQTGSECFSLFLVNRLTEGDVNDQLGEHPKFCLEVGRGSTPIIEALYGTVRLPGYDEIPGNINELGDSMQLFVKRGDPQPEGLYLTSIKVVDYRPIQFAFEYKTYDELLVDNFDQVENDRRKSRKDLMKKTSWSLFKLLMYSTLGRSEQVRGAAFEVKKSSFAEMFINILSDATTWIPSELQSSGCLEISKVAEGVLWGPTSSVLKSKENVVSKWVADYIRETEQVRESLSEAEKNSKDTDKVMSLVHEWVKLDPFMKGVLKKEEMPEYSSEMECFTNSNGEVDFFCLINYFKRELRDGLSIAQWRNFFETNAMFKQLPVDYYDSLTFGSNDEVTRRVRHLKHTIRPSEDSILKYLDLIDAKADPSRPGIVPRGSVPKLTPGGFLNSDSELDLYKMVNYIRGNSERFSGYFQELSPSLHMFAGVSKTCSDLYSKAQNNELTASVLLTLLLSCGSVSARKALARPQFMGEFLKQMFLGNTLKIVILAFKLVRVLLQDQHSPMSIAGIYEQVPKEQLSTVLSPKLTDNLLTVLLSLVALKTYSPLSDHSMPWDNQRLTRMSLEANEMLKSLLNSERWAADIHSLMETTLLQKLPKMTESNHPEVCLLVLGSLLVLNNSINREFSLESQPIEMSPMLLSNLRRATALHVAANTCNIQFNADEPHVTKPFNEILATVSEVRSLPAFSQEFKSSIFASVSGSLDRLQGLSKLSLSGSARRLHYTRAFYRVVLSSSYEVLTLLAPSQGSYPNDRRLQVIASLLSKWPASPQAEVNRVHTRQSALKKFLLKSADSQTLDKQKGQILFMLSKADNALIEVNDTTDLCQCFQSNSGRLSISSPSRVTSRVEVRRAISSVVLRTVSGIPHDLTILAAVASLHPGSVFGVLLGDFEIIVCEREANAEVRIEQVKYNVPKAAVYKFRILASFDGALTITLMDNPQTFSHNSRNRSVFDGISLSNCGVVLLEGRSAELRAFAICLGKFTGQVNLGDLEGAHEAVSGPQFNTGSLNSARLQLVGADSATAKRLAGQHFAASLRNVLPSTAGNQVVQSLSFDNPIVDIALLDSISDIKDGYVTVPYLEDGVEVGNSMDLSLRKILVVRPYEASLLTYKCLSSLSLIEAGYGEHEVGNWGVQDELKVFAKFVDPSESRSPICGFALISGSDPVKVPFGFEVLKRNDIEINIAATDKPIYLAVRTCSYFYGIPTANLLYSRAKAFNIGLLDSFSSSGSSEDEKQLAKEIEEYAELSEAELHSKLTGLEDFITQSRLKQLLKQLVKQWPETAVFTEDTTASLFRIFAEDLEALKAPVLAALQSRDAEDMSRILLQYLTFQLTLACTVPTTGSKGEMNFESQHPYINSLAVDQCISVPGAERLIIEFDPQCSTENNCDHLRFYKNEGRVNVLKEFTGKSFSNFEVEGSVVYFAFTSDGSNVDWGYKFKVKSVFKAAVLKKDPLAQDLNLEAALWTLDQIALRTDCSQILQPCVLRAVFVLLHSPFTSEKTRIMEIMKKLLLAASTTPETAMFVDVLSEEALQIYKAEHSQDKSELLQSLISALIELSSHYQVSLKETWFDKLLESFDMIQGIIDLDDKITGVLIDLYLTRAKVSLDVFRESDHPYPKAIVTRELSFPRADGLLIEFDDKTAQDPGDAMLFTYDSQGLNPIQMPGSQVAQDSRWAMLQEGPDISVTEGGTKITRTNSSGWGTALWSEVYTQGVVTITFSVDSDGDSNYWYIGVCKASATYPLTDVFGADCSVPCWCWKKPGEAISPGSTNSVEGYATGDLLSYVIDMNNRTMTICKNNTTVYTFQGLAEAVIPYACFGGLGQVLSLKGVTSSGGLDSVKRVELPIGRVFYHFPVNVGYVMLNSHVWTTYLPSTMTVTADRKVVASKADHTERSIVVSTQTFSSGRHFIALRVVKAPQGSKLQIGFLPKGTSNGSMVSQNSVVIQSDGRLQFGSIEMVGPVIQGGDMIGCYLDFNTKEAQFYRNQELIGKSLVTLKENALYNFAVAINAPDTELQLLTDPPVPEELDITKVGEGTSQEWGYKFKASPVFASRNKSAVLGLLTDVQQQQLSEFSNKYRKLLNRNALEHIVALADEVAAVKGLDLLTVQTQDFVAASKERLAFAGLDEATTQNLEECFFVVQKFNQNIKDLLPLMSLDFPDSNHMSSLSRYFTQARGMIFAKDKDAIFKPAISKTSNDIRTEIAIDRTKTIRAKDAGRVDKELSWSIFGQVLKLMNEVPNPSLRNSERIFKVEFKGEGAIDVGGPYNEVIADIAEELQSPYLLLMVPSQNQIQNVGMNRDAWLISPRSASLLEPFLFLGKLFGVAIRTQNNLNLTLPPLFWKRLMLEEVTREDLRGVDEVLHQMLEILQDLPGHDITPDNFRSMFADETFVAKDSSSQEIELMPGGRKVDLTYESAREYARLVTVLRLTEAAEAYMAMRKGMSAVVPLNLLNLYSWKQVETLVCGAADVDPDILKENTEYADGDGSAPHIQYFWEVLRELSPKERSMFLKFVWGRSKLPAGKNFRKFKIAGSGRSGNVDGYLPVSHTCFFTLDLPAYSSKDVMKAKLTYAIYNCQAIDLDRVATGGWEED